MLAADNMAAAMMTVSFGIAPVHLDPASYTG
jgi:hypothetical protein